jgi:copper resistance protein B
MRVLLLTCIVAASALPALAQEPPPQPTRDPAADMSTPEAQAPGGYRIPGTAPNPLAAPEASPAVAMPLSPVQTNVTPAQPMPPAIKDNRNYSFTLFDVFEYRPKGKDSDVRFDVEGWAGGDYRRFVYKTEGEIALHGNDYEGELQLLSSRLRKPYTSLQYGLRLEAKKYGGANVVRPQAVIGLESLAPYKFHLDTALYVDPKGHVMADFTGSKDILLTQRLILQGRLEAQAGLQEVERFGFGSGLRSTELGLRLRYEIKREFAPYIGISYFRAYGGTANFIRRDGGDPAKWRFVAGIRAWF